MVLGAFTAERLGISDVDLGVLVYLGGEWFAPSGETEVVPVEVGAQVGSQVQILSGVEPDVTIIAP